MREGARAEVVDGVDEVEPALPDQADAIGDVLYLGEDVRGEEDRAAALGGLGDELVERLLHERVEAARRLVEDEQVGIVHERLDEPDLLPVSAGELLDPAVEVEVEPFREGVAPAPASPRRWPKNSSSSRPVIRS